MEVDDRESSCRESRVEGPFARRRQQGEAGFTLSAVLIEERDTSRGAR
jgi:hypothetical protein